MRNYIINIKNLFVLLALLLLMISCSKQENDENDPQQIIKLSAIKEVDKNENFKSESIEKKSEHNIVTNDISIPGELLIIDSLSFRKIVSGSWSSFQKSPNTKRVLSWGEVPVIDTEYLLIDLIANDPVIIIGGSEGGPGFDHQIARISGFIQERNSFWLFYNVIEAGFQTNNEIISEDVKKVLIHYNPNQDTIRIDQNSVFAGGIYSKDYTFRRVSSVIE